MSRFECPYCFAVINSKTVRLSCGNHDCLKPDKRRTAFFYGVSAERILDDDKSATDGGFYSVQKYPTVFKPGKGNLFTRLLNRQKSTPFHCPDCLGDSVRVCPECYSQSFSANCPECGTPSFTHVCPECHSPLPYGVGEQSNQVIAVVGAKETGKSHYIAVLIQRITELYATFGWTLSAMDDDTIRGYKERFHRALYEEYPPRTLGITQPATAYDAAVKKPLFYTLGLTRRNRYKTITLILFDTAGEDLYNETQMRTLSRYIYHASGIILLLDPLQLPKMRDEIVRREAETENLPSNANPYAGDIINRIANLIRVGRSLANDRKIPIPLAVAFSKLDMLRSVLGESSPVFQKTRHQGRFDKREFAEIDGLIRGWIDREDIKKALIQQTLSFSEVGFFGVSALGGNPDARGYLRYRPRPIRVEDPFLWLLWKNHLI